MTDDLDDLRQAMKAATPAPNADRKAENIALAKKSFADLQGSHDGVRPTSNRPLSGFWTGAFNMLHSLTSRAGLTASTAIVAVGLVFLTPLGDGLMNSGRLTVDHATPSQPVKPAPVSVAEQTRSASEVVEDQRAAESAVVMEAPTVEPMVRPNIAMPAPADQAYGALSGRALGAAKMADQPPQLTLPDTEAFANADANPVHLAAQDPVSTFSIDVDTASYAVIRQALEHGQLPPQDAVRIEEMINYFPYDYSAPTDGSAFKPTVSISQTPWNPDTRLVQIALQGEMPVIAARPPLNLVFLIDTSGSMNHPDKLPLLKQSFRLMLGQLRPEDSIAIVTYAGSAGQVLAPTAASDRETILQALDKLDAGGSTAGQEGLQQAYATAAAMTGEGEISRVILATDGDFNVGLSDPEALKKFIAAKRDSGTYLGVLGFGRGNLDDATMQALAQNGNGMAAYIDTLGEAQKVLVDQLTGALFPIANDVKVQVEFNPATVAEYRLIGYETRALRREDFNNDKVDAGDIGAGHQVTALYEVTPVGSPAQLNDPLRYGSAPAAPQPEAELGFLRLRYKAPASDKSQLIEAPIANGITDEAGFAAAVAGFGQLLRGGTYLGDWSYDDAIELATRTKGDDPFGYRTEAVQLMRLAASLSAN